MSLNYVSMQQKVGGKTLCVPTQGMNRLEKYNDNHLFFVLIIQLKYLYLEILRYSFGLVGIDI